MECSFYLNDELWSPCPLTATVSASDIRKIPNVAFVRILCALWKELAGFDQFNIKCAPIGC